MSEPPQSAATAVPPTRGAALFKSVAAAAALTSPSGKAWPKTIRAGSKEAAALLAELPTEAELAEAVRREEEDARRKELEEIAKQKREEEAERKRQEEEEALRKLPHATIVIAADNDAIFDWQLRKMIVDIPMTHPVRPYVERTVCQRMKWPDLMNYCFYKALGSSADTVEGGDEVLQTNLTPTQLHMTSSGLNFVQLRKSRKTDEEILLPAYEFFRNKVERFLEYYDPHRLSKAQELLQKNQGDEQAVIDDFLRRYGPEPTDQQLNDKREFLKLQKERADAAAEAARLQGRTNKINTLSDKEKENVMRIVEKVAYTRVQTNFYKKWRQWVLRRRINRMIVTLSNTHLERIRLKEFYGKFKIFAENRKNKRQLGASSQIAVKNESLLGDLASQNMGLKNEIRKLTAHIEVLENASSRRLETLYSGSEAAVSELRRLTAELRQKAIQVHHLTLKKEANEKKLQASEQIKEDAIAQCASTTAEFDAQESEYRMQLRILENQNLALQDKVGEINKSLAGTGGSDCNHCPHYHQTVAQSTANRAQLDGLRTRIENSEGSKRVLQVAIDKLKEEQQEMLENGGVRKKSESEIASENDKRIPQIFLEIEERERRIAEGEDPYDIDNEIASGKGSLQMQVLQESLAKQEKEKQQQEKEKQRQDQQQQGGDVTSPSADTFGGGRGLSTTMSTLAQERGMSSLSDATAGGAPGAGGTSGSILGPVGKTDLSMARYFENEINRSRVRVKQAQEKQWGQKTKTIYASELQSIWKTEAAEAAKQSTYVLNRKQAASQGVYVAPRQEGNTFDGNPHASSALASGGGNSNNQNNQNNNNENAGTGIGKKGSAFTLLK